jgi:acyl-CoA thioester hydrolase
MIPPARRPDPRRFEQDRYPFAVEVQTRWGDLDVQGHVNNVMVGRLFEEARVHFWNGVHAAGGGPVAGVAAAVYIDYVREVRHPAPVVVGVGVAGSGTRSTRLLQAMFQDGECVAVAEVTNVRPRHVAEPAAAATKALSAALGRFAVRSDDNPQPG